MQHYVHVIGPYDSTAVGPFPDRETATEFRATVPPQFDAAVIDQTRFDADVVEFGPIVAESPDRYGFGVEYAFTGHE